MRPSVEGGCGESTEGQEGINWRGDTVWVLKMSVGKGRKDIWDHKTKAMYMQNSLNLEIISSNSVWLGYKECHA
jgi:hypothetical protein